MTRLEVTYAILLHWNTVNNLHNAERNGEYHQTTMKNNIGEIFFKYSNNYNYVVYFQPIYIMNDYLQLFTKIP